MSQPSIPTGLPVALPQAGADGLPRRFGKYTLLRKLATGGMAELFLALHRAVAGFEKLVVIKRILPSMNQDQAFIEMLLHEARIAATLSHPNVVQIFDVGHLDGCYYIAMEHIHGEDLRSIVRQMKKRGMSEFPTEHALSIVLGTCAGLAYAHEKRGLDGQPLNIVHRDISPQNILVTYAGDVKVVDFGIAKSGRTQMGEDTRSGRLKGKVPYMSPEQARGEEIDWRSDIFATGIILFELTTGKRLFKGQNELETLRLICEREYPRPSLVRAGYPRRLEAIVMRALARNRDERYQSARELQSDLESYIRDDRIAVSDIQLSKWMEVLFEDRIAQQKEALQDVKQLADIIAAQSTTESGTFDSIADTTGRTMGSVSGATAALGAAPAAPRSKLPIVVALVIALVVIAAGAFVLLRRTNPQPGAATSSSAVVEPKAELGSIRIESDPSDASIVINGDLRSEKTPATIDKLPLGTALSIKVTKEGYAPARYEVTLTADKRNDVFKAVLPKGTVKVTVACNVTNPYLLLDGKPVTGPTIEGISANEEHKLTAAAQGYTTRSQAFMAGPNETKSLTFTLEKEKPGAKKEEPSEPEPPKATGSGKLNVGSRGGYCTVSVDGRTYGPTPVGGISLPAGNHRVTCRTEAGKTLSQGVKIDADQTARVSFSIE
ncbi:MAG: serine/threonine protein kinase [Deltaproteobacteria bacterium]|nr:serine/threonine protein kinase [Deltaproteobacteria bacterium]